MIWISLDRKFYFKSSEIKIFDIQVQRLRKNPKLRSANSDYIASFELVIYMTHMDYTSQLLFYATK